MRVPIFAGEVVWSATSHPYGKYSVEVETVQNNLRASGQYFDHETGLHYNNQRYYDVNTGRYLEFDRVGVIGGLGYYVFASANPISYLDVTGFMPRRDIVEKENCVMKKPKIYSERTLERYVDHERWEEYVYTFEITAPGCSTIGKVVFCPAYQFELWMIQVVAMLQKNNLTTWLYTWECTREGKCGEETFEITDYDTVETDWYNAGRDSLSTSYVQKPIGFTGGMGIGVGGLGGHNNGSSFGPDSYTPTSSNSSSWRHQ